jgi:hypothetical protein
MEASMFDVIAIVVLMAMFGLAVSYVHGCDRLRGSRA